VRYPQPNNSPGSLKWIQRAVNKRPEYLNRVVRDACNIPGDEAIEWVSPLADDEWAEYRDEEMRGPRTIPEWQTALTVVKSVLGLPKRHRLSNCVSDVFLDVAELI